MYEKLRNQIDSFIAEQSNCCSIGCSHCCYQTIEILDIEFDFIKKVIDSLDEKHKYLIFQNLVEYWNFFNENTPYGRELTPDDVFTSFQNLPKEKKVKCPLLIDDKCSIYKERPLTCRIHVVENNPEYCKANPYRDSAPNASQFRGNIIYTLRRDRSIELRPLAYIVSEVIDPKRKLKSVEKIIMPKI